MAEKEESQRSVNSVGEAWSPPCQAYLPQGEHPGLTRLRAPAEHCGMRAAEKSTDKARRGLPEKAAKYGSPGTQAR